MHGQCQRTTQNNKLITQGEKLETVIAKVRVFVSNISSSQSPIWVFVFFCNARRWTACVQQKFESVYLGKVRF